MKRRGFIAGLLGMVTAPFAAKVVAEDVPHWKAQGWPSEEAYRSFWSQKDMTWRNYTFSYSDPPPPPTDRILVASESVAVGAFRCRPDPAREKRSCALLRPALLRLEAVPDPPADRLRRFSVRHAAEGAAAPAASALRR